MRCPRVIFAFLHNFLFCLELIIAFLFVCLVFYTCLINSFLDSPAEVWTSQYLRFIAQLTAQFHLFPEPPLCQLSAPGCLFLGLWPKLLLHQQPGTPPFSFYWIPRFPLPSFTLCLRKNILQVSWERAHGKLWSCCLFVLSLLLHLLVSVVRHKSLPKLKTISSQNFEGIMWFSSSPKNSHDFLDSNPLWFPSLSLPLPLSLPPFGNLNDVSWLKTSLSSIVQRSKPCSSRKFSLGHFLFFSVVFVFWFCLFFPLILWNFCYLDVRILFWEAQNVVVKGTDSGPFCCFLLYDIVPLLPHL